MSRRQSPHLEHASGPPGERRSGPGCAARRVLQALMGLSLLAAGTAILEPDSRRAAASHSEPEVVVEVLGRLQPTRIEVSGPSHLYLHAHNDTLYANNQLAAPPFELPRGRWTLRADREAPRRYHGSLSLRARDGIIEVVVRLPLEAYTAEVVASELAGGAPLEALKAMAVVSRSYALAEGARHPSGGLCDMAHCQVLSARSDPDHLLRAERATQETRGQVLRLADGAVARAPFHAACGGHTADPQQIFGREERTGAQAVPDPGCPASPWEVKVARETLAEALSASFEAAGGEVGLPINLDSIRLAYGAGGYAIQVREVFTGRVASADALVRALGERIGWTQVKSSRFVLKVAEQSVFLRGAGFGHGVGLCQAGALARARDGADYRQILSHYFRASRSVLP